MQKQFFNYVSSAACTTVLSFSSQDIKANLGHVFQDGWRAVVCVRDILDILAQCNRPKPNPACTSSLGFSRLYILIL